MPKSVPRESPFLKQCKYVGFVSGQQRWRSRDRKRIYTWDALHGEIEVFNRQGLHLGVLDRQGRPTKDAVKGRKIDV